MVVALGAVDVGRFQATGDYRSQFHPPLRFQATGDDAAHKAQEWRDKLSAALARERELRERAHSAHRPGSAWSRPGRTPARSSEKSAWEDPGPFIGTAADDVLRSDTWEQHMKSLPRRDA